MTLNHFIEAVADKLTGLWPDRKVYVDRIPRNANGNFFVGLIESEHAKRLDRRRKRLLQFEVLYFLRTDDSMAFQAWAEALYDAFESLTVAEAAGVSRLVRPTNQRARRDEEQMVFQFLFDIDFSFVLAPESGPGMESLEQKEVLK